MKSHIKIKGKILDNWRHFYLSEPPVLAKGAGCKSCFALTLISQNRHFHMWRDMLIKYSSLKYSEFILAFQLQFGIYEAETPFQRVIFKINRPFIFWLSCCRSISIIPVFKGSLNTICVFKAASYVE